MLNNPALEIAIGLVFIYAIYSLLVTTLTELVSAWIGIRAKNLKKGIKRMLDDDNQNYFKGIFNKSNDQNLSEKVLTQPEIVFLGKKKNIVGKNKMPSYIKPETFVKSFINGLEETYSFKGDLSSLKDSLAKNKENVLTNTQLIRLIEEANEDVSKFKELSANWFNETMERANGWFKRRIKLWSFAISLTIAFGMQIDTIAISNKLGKDDNARLELITAASAYTSSYKAIDSLPQDVIDRIELLNQKIDSMLNDTKVNESIMKGNKPEKVLKNLFLKDKEKRKVSLQYIFGCFLTALAFSLGAPFWFDLLNKLVQLRASGSVETTTKNDKPVG